MTATGDPTCTSFEPTGTKMAARYPLSTASKPRVALSVSSSAMASPGLILSPTFFNHDAMLPCVIVGDNAGMSKTLCSGSAVDKRRSCSLDRERGAAQATAGDGRFTNKVLQTTTAGLERRAVRARVVRPLARTERPRNRCRVLMVTQFSSICLCKSVVLLCNAGPRRNAAVLNHKDEESSGGSRAMLVQRS